jgi:hypothetical protein
MKMRSTIRLRLVRAATVAVALVTASAAHASTQDQYNNLVGRYASTSIEKVGNTACVCTGASSVGWLVEIPAVLEPPGAPLVLECMVPSFDTGGSIVFRNFCTDFGTLAR